MACRCDWGVAYAMLLMISHLGAKVELLPLNFEQSSTTIISLRCIFKRNIDEEGLRTKTSYGLGVEDKVLLCQCSTTTCMNTLHCMYLYLMIYLSVCVCAMSPGCNQCGQALEVPIVSAM